VREGEGSAAEHGKQVAETVGDEFHAHGGHDQPHQPGDDVDAGAAEQAVDGRCQPKEQCGEHGQDEDGDGQGKGVGGRGVALGVEDDRADRPRPGQERCAQRHHGNAVPLGGIQFLLPGLLDIAHLGVEHGDGHEQDEDTAAHSERIHRDGEEAKDGLTADQDEEQDDAHGQGGQGAVAVAGCRVLTGRHVDEDRQDAHRVDDAQQGDEKLEVFVETSGFHRPSPVFCPRCGHGNKKGVEPNRSNPLPVCGSGERI